MKTTIATALAFFALATSATFAQGVPSRNFDNRQPQYANQRFDYDQYQDDLKIDRIDALVGLSRQQERQLHRIEDNYDRIAQTSRMTPDGFRQLQLRKRQDMLAVLTPIQRDRLFATQQPNWFNNRNQAPFGRRG